ncbi:unnamed protein product, partial [Didymodactylos carnosus]
MAKFAATQQYESSSESDDAMEMDQQATQEKVTIKRKFDWVEEKSFCGDAEAQMAIALEEKWSRYYTNKGLDGIRVYYRCNQVKFRGKQCNAAIYLYYPHETDTVVLYRAKRELESWCQEKSTVPHSEVEAFVISFYIHYEDDTDNDDEDVADDGNKFRFFLSTKALLKIASISKNLHADATYKLIWQGFPVLVIGTSDYDRKFHPFGLAICYDEKQSDFEFIFK